MKEFFNDKVLPVVTNIANHHYVKAIQQGVMALMAFTIFSGIISIIKTPPFTATTTNGFALAWMSFATANQDWLNVTYQMLNGLMAMLAIIGIITSLCNYYKMQPLNPILVGIVSFLIVSVRLVPMDPVNPGAGIAMDFAYLGASGLFSAMIMSFLVVEILRFMAVKGVKIKMPASVPPMIAQPFESMIASAAVIIIAILIRVIFAAFGMMFPQLILVLLSPILKGAENFWTIVFLFMFSRVLWFFGIHGTSIVFSVLMPIMMQNTVANLDAYNAGLPIEHSLASGFIVFQLGMLPAAIAMLIVCKSKQLKVVARLGIIPTCFMISEPILFGTPFVFNPILFIPHVLAFGVSTGVAFLAMDSGLVGKPIFGAPGQIPGPIAAFISTLDWKAVVLWFVVVILCVLIYMPFLKVYDRKLLAEELASEETE